MEPILKWAGGKRRLLTALKEYISPELISGHRYYEPFVGGGSFAFNLEYENTTINDLNPEVTNVYQMIKDNPEELVRELKHHQDNHSKDYYYNMRDVDRDEKSFRKMSRIKRAARMIYLNRTCYNGLYRVNSKGYFNVPIGRSAQNTVPDIVMEDRIQKLSQLFNRDGFIIKCGEYFKSVEDASAGDVVYFDPPYDYEKEGFKAYIKTGFFHEDLLHLKDVCDELIERGCRVFLSNNDTQFVRECFSGENYIIHTIAARRMINCKSDGRKLIDEVIICGRKDELEPMARML